MISKETLKTEWIHKVSAQNKNADRILVEKVIRALLLLEGLVQAGLPFVFKGGTALMLLQGIPKRFSIDIDIIVSEKIDFEIVFGNFLTENGFSRFEIINRKSSGSIEKYHYKFFYNPAHSESASEDNIFLDIHVEAIQYEDVQSIEINSPFVIHNENQLNVNIPCFEDMLGDKLTAFAPNTTGVPYLKNDSSRAMEIIKQLYDIGNLFSDISDIEKVARTFKKFAVIELQYRSLINKWEDVLDDIIQTALCISTKGVGGNGDFNALQKGISQIGSYIYTEKFHIEKAIVFSARAAYCAMLIKNKETEILRFKNPDQIIDLLIEQPFETKLNKLKKTNSEAFFYWYQVYLMNNRNQKIEIKG